MLPQIQKLLNESQFLESDEVNRLVEEYQCGNSHAGQQLVEAYIPLINKICAEYTNGYTLSIGRDDLFQEAVIGFYKSLNSFNSKQGNLSVYATQYMRRMILDFILDNKKIIRTITTKDMRKMYFNRFKYIDANGVLDVHTMAEQEDIPIHRVIEFNERMKFNPTYDVTNDDGQRESVIDRIECEWSTITEYEDRQEYTKQRNDIHKSLNVLTERENEIINRVYLTKEPETMSAIAREYAVSPQRIQQIERNAVKKIKANV